MLNRPRTKRENDAVAETVDRSADYLRALEIRRADILERCVACGRCAEVCPMPAPAGLEIPDGAALTAAVLSLLRTGRGSEDARRWAEICTGSGHCIPECGYGVNPRFMLKLARIAALRTETDPAQLRAGGAGPFGAMSRGVRVLSRLQLAPDELARLGQAGLGASEPENPDIVFYTGCNVLKTPHIVLLCLDVLDALDVSYVVRGGPSFCCGVHQFASGDLEKFGATSLRTVDRFAATGARQVLSWCPSCQVHLGEASLETRAAVGPADFALTPFVLYLASRLADLRGLMVGPVEKRVGLHEHPGVAGVSEAAETVLRAIPGLSFVDLAQPRIGYMCNTLSVLPDHKRGVHAAQLEAAADAGVEVLAGVYHACHRELCAHERDWPFEVVNFMELVGESMGLARADLFKRLKVMQDIDAIVSETAEMIDLHGLDINEVRSVLAETMLAEQPLPLNGPATGA